MWACTRQHFRKAAAVLQEVVLIHLGFLCRPPTVLTVSLSHRHFCPPCPPPSPLCFLPRRQRKAQVKNVCVVPYLCLCGLQIRVLNLFCTLGLPGRARLHTSQEQHPWACLWQLRLLLLLPSMSFQKQSFLVTRKVSS